MWNFAGLLAGLLAQYDSCHRIPTMRFAPQLTNENDRALEYQHWLIYAINQFTTDTNHYFIAVNRLIQNMN